MWEKSQAANCTSYTSWSLYLCAVCLLTSKIVPVMCGRPASWFRISTYCLSESVWRLCLRVQFAFPGSHFRLNLRNRVVPISWFAEWMEPVEHDRNVCATNTLGKWSQAIDWFYWHWFQCVKSQTRRNALHAFSTLFNCYCSFISVFLED